MVRGVNKSNADWTHGSGALQTYGNYQTKGPKDDGLGDQGTTDLVDTTGGIGRVSPPHVAAISATLTVVTAVALLLGAHPATLWIVVWVASSIVALTYGLRATRSTNHAHNRTWWFGRMSIIVAALAVAAVPAIGVIIPDHARYCPSGQQNTTTHDCVPLDTGPNSPVNSTHLIGGP